MTEWLANSPPYLLAGLLLLGPWVRRRHNRREAERQHAGKAPQREGWYL